MIEDLSKIVFERLVAWVENPAIQPKAAEEIEADEDGADAAVEGDADSPPKKRRDPPKRLPTSILFYRDGIFEPQYSMCREFGILQAEKAYKQLATKHNQPSASLRLAFIMKSKQHHLRFFPKRPDG